MSNYYELLNIPMSSSIITITIAYKTKIAQFNNIGNLNEEQIAQIKNLKKALFVLSNQNLRKNYDDSINLRNANDNDNDNANHIADNNNANANANANANNNNNNNANDNDNNVQCANNYDDTLEEQFTIPNYPKQNDYVSDKPNKLDSSILGQRIFSLSHMNKQHVMTDFEIRPQMSRIDKNN